MSCLNICQLYQLIFKHFPFLSNVALQTTPHCSFRLPALCIFHDNLWDAQKNLHVSSWTHPGGKLLSKAIPQQHHSLRRGEDRNHSAKHLDTCESTFPNSTKLANKQCVFVPLILSFQEGDIRSLHWQSEDKKLVAESTLGRCLRKGVEGCLRHC